MKRLSYVVEEGVSNVQGVGGRCLAKHEDPNFVDGVTDFLPHYMLADAVLVSTGVFLEGVARVLEYSVARPLYHLENLIFGKVPSPGWVFEGLRR